MKCEFCKVNEASVEVRQLAEGELREAHLCVDCARAHGLKAPADISAFLTGEDLPWGGDDVSLSCPACHLRLSDFRKTSRLGCAQCYETFAAVLQPMLEAMHGATGYKGKQPVRAQIRDELTVLTRKLDEAVAHEAYEAAAVLRDQIQVLELAGACVANGGDGL